MPMPATTTTPLPSTQIRPRFQIETPYSVDELCDMFTQHLQKDNQPCIGYVQNGHGTITLPIEEQHYWSPQLSLTIEATEEGSLLRGLYGPRPTVWTMFVFFYAIIGFTTTIITLIGFSYYSLDMPGAWILYLVPILLLLFLSLYLVSYSGQKMGKGQIDTLHQFVGECVEKTA